MSAQDKIDEAFTEVGAQLKQRVSGLNGITAIWQGTAAQYAAITTPSPTTIYVIKG